MSNLKKINITRNDTLLMVAALTSYTGMYAVRKSFLAGQYLDSDYNGYDFKTILVISQVLGYMLSKFIGIKIVSEHIPEQRPRMLVTFLSFAMLMLLVFALAPVHLKPVALFLNGLPLGMVFGLVLSYLEGRKNTELLVAALSATFIFSTGFIKTTGVWLMQSFSVNEYFMPFMTGLLFFPFFLLAVWFLKSSKAPSIEDIAARSKRTPMNKKQRQNFLKTHGLPFASLVIIYVLLTAVRDFRDNFTVEFWSELGYANQPSLITLTEIPVAITVLLIAALGILIHNNRKAFNWSIYTTLFGAISLLISTSLFTNGFISPINWMVWSGLGIYLPYILFHCLVFERFLALLKHEGTIGYLFYVADALGYLFSVGILISKEVMDYRGSWTNLFSQLNIYSAFGIISISIIILVLNRQKQTITI
ncbi:DUF5690 domain-containing protein [Zobellia roscoffensis]|uniref:DUF5690 family protein n=1 Tax=Zobellia roscoffensis TaxID=2779508 RepID=UPI00188B30BD|nr:DUF5690 family protein [Zobellia roscoffensis]